MFHFNGATMFQLEQLFHLEHHTCPPTIHIFSYSWLILWDSPQNRFCNPFLDVQAFQKLKNHLEFLIFSAHQRNYPFYFHTNYVVRKCAQGIFSNNTRIYTLGTLLQRRNSRSLQRIDLRSLVYSSYSFNIYHLLFLTLLFTSVATLLPFIWLCS